MADPTPNNSKWLTPRTIAFAVCLALTGVILITLQTLVDSENRLFLSESRAHVLDHTSVVRAELEHELNSELLLTRGLVTHISRSPDITEDQFSDIAQDFYSISKHIRNIGLAKGLVLTFVHPIEGNETAIGLVYDENPAQWPAVEKAIKTRQTVIAGPLELVQGGQAIISRTPIFLPRDVAPNDQTYYGIVSTVLNIDSLLNAGGINGREEIETALRTVGELDGDGQVFQGDPTIFQQDPVILDITLPTGAWQLAAIPADGWPTSAPFVKTHRTVAGVTAVFMNVAVTLIALEFERRRKLEVEQKELIAELQTALQEVKTLSGLLPICASCKNIRDDKGYWQQIEGYFHTHSDVKFSHGMCPKCAEKMYAEIDALE